MVHAEATCHQLLCIISWDLGETLEVETALLRYFVRGSVPHLPETKSNVAQRLSGVPPVDTTFERRRPISFCAILLHRFDVRVDCSTWVRLEAFVRSFFCLIDGTLPARRLPLFYQRPIPWLALQS